jgi:hypothetical protein
MKRFWNKGPKAEAGEAIIPDTEEVSGDEPVISLDKEKPVKEGFMATFRSRLSRSKKSDDGGSSSSDEALNEDGLEEILPGRGMEVSFDGERILQVDKYKVILGMLWDAAQQGESPKKQAADVSTIESTYDLVANHRDASQIGFADSSNGFKPGFKAGVTSFNEAQMGQSWLGAFRLGPNSDFYWVVSNRNGQVYEDQIFSDSDQARMAFLENLEAPNWQRTIAPDDWGIGGTEEHLIHDVIDPSKGVSLKPANMLKAYLPRLIVLGVLIATGVGGWVYYQGHLKEQAALEAELDKQKRESVRVSPSDYPWYDTPDLKMFIEGCFSKVEKALRVIPGWSQEIISCRLNGTDAMLQTAWVNSGGTIPWMVTSFSTDEVQPIIAIDGSVASYSTEIEFGVETEVLAEAWEEDQIERMLRRRIQTTGVSVKMAAIVSRMTPSQQMDLKKPIFNFHDMSFSASSSLLEYAKLFSDVPAAVPQTIVYDVKSKVWNVNFRIYHPAILPIAR